jgi:hypothetical protein
MSIYDVVGWVAMNPWIIPVAFVGGVVGVLGLVLGGIWLRIWLRS